MLAANGRLAHAPHGLQVGYATGFAMRLQLYGFGGGLGELCPPRTPAWGDEEMRRLFAGHDTQVDDVMEQKRQFLAENASKWPTTQARWAAVKERVGEPVAVFPTVAEALSIAGIPSEPGFLDLDAATLRTCFRWANRIRPRYTVLDFLEGQGRLDDAIDDLFPSTSSGS
jgi:glycerol-1-phosphate dehydrogenase [NAD(P)+]